MENFAGIAYNEDDGARREGAMIGDNRNLKDLMKHGKIYVWQGTYAMVRAERPCRGAVAVIRDRKETTCLVREPLAVGRSVLAADLGWKIITFDMVLPFSLVGFLARVTAALAGAGISICAMAAYSTDHILVKARDLEKALATLEKLGFTVDRKER
jgi:hypothetical protein